MVIIKVLRDRGNTKIKRQDQIIAQLIIGCPDRPLLDRPYLDRLYPDRPYLDRA